MNYKLKLKFAIDAARGLIYLHGSNPSILHRDLKSDNLLVTQDWTVKVRWQFFGARVSQWMQCMQGVAHENDASFVLLTSALPSLLSLSLSLCSLFSLCAGGRFRSDSFYFREEADDPGQLPRPQPHQLSSLTTLRPHQLAFAQRLRLTALCVRPSFSKKKKKKKRLALRCGWRQVSSASACLR